MDSSISPLITAEEDLLHLDRDKGIEFIKKFINRCNDWTVFQYANAMALMVECDGIVVKDRVARYEIRRIYGEEAAPWDSVRDEKQIRENSTLIDSMQMTECSIAEEAVASSMEAVGNNRQPLLPTGQTMGPFEDPAGMTVADLYVAQFSATEQRSTRPNLLLSNSIGTIPRSTSERRVTMAPQAQSTRAFISPVPFESHRLEERPINVADELNVSREHQLFGALPTNSVITPISSVTVTGTNSIAMPTSRRYVAQGAITEAVVRTATATTTTSTTTTAVTRAEHSRSSIWDVPTMNVAPAEHDNCVSRQQYEESMIKLGQLETALRALQARILATTTENEATPTCLSQQHTTQRTRDVIASVPAAEQTANHNQHRVNSEEWSRQSHRDAAMLPTSTLVREKQLAELFTIWHISFKGAKKQDPEGFLANIHRCKWTYDLSLDDIIRALPAVIDEETFEWYRREYVQWQTYEEFVQAFRLQYGVENLQDRLQHEIEVRTQGPQEPISEFINKFRGLLDRLRPPLSREEQLNRAYRNLHPSYRTRITRSQFSTFTELQRLGKLEESRRERDRAYRPPPEDSAFPSSVYTPPRNPRSNKLAAISSKPIVQEQAQREVVKSVAPVANTGQQGKATVQQQQIQWKQRQGQPQRENSVRPNVSYSQALSNSRSSQSSFSRGNYNYRVHQAQSNSRTTPQQARGPTQAMVVEKGNNASYPSTSGRVPKFTHPRKLKEPCFRCGEIGHWAAECKQPIACFGCGKLNTRVKECNCQQKPLENAKQRRQ